MEEGVRAARLDSLPWALPDPAGQHVERCSAENRQGLCRVKRLRSTTHLNAGDPQCIELLTQKTYLLRSEAKLSGEQLLLLLPASIRKTNPLRC